MLGFKRICVGETHKQREREKQTNTVFLGAKKCTDYFRFALNADTHSCAHTLTHTHTHTHSHTLTHTLTYTHSHTHTQFQGFLRKRFLPIQPKILMTALHIKINIIHLLYCLYCVCVCVCVCMCVCVFRPEKPEEKGVK